MSHIAVNGRAYITDIDDFGYNHRTLLQIKDSAYILSDTNIKKAYIGISAQKELVDPVTKLNALDELLHVPFDFRVHGISVLDMFGISKIVQGQMFDTFIRDYTKEQRTIYINKFLAINPTDSAAVQAFVNNMISLLTPPTPAPAPAP